MSRMFHFVTSTWNVYKGCRFDCSYCNAKKAAETRFRHIPRYQDGFKPKLIEKELGRRFKPGEFIFVAYMGDIAFATSDELLRIWARIREFPETDFLIQTKNPEHIYVQWDDHSIRLPDNVVFGTTIETNRDYGLSKAPPAYDRFLYLNAYPDIRKFVSIEPICDFDLETMVTWMRITAPVIIEIGADNYGNNLPEPPWSKVEDLLKRLREICPEVKEKEGLERLKGR